MAIEADGVSAGGKARRRASNTHAPDLPFPSAQDLGSGTGLGFRV